MSTSRTVKDDARPAVPHAMPPRNLRPLGLEVNRRVSALQREYLADTSASARATLAHLRNAANAAPGSVPTIWELTIAGIPGQPSDTTMAPTREERAAHAALTLYASHQQSVRDPMHAPGIGLGHAVERLAPKGDGRRGAVRRRFDAVATASTLEEAAHHLRGLVGQLRSAKIPLDYGQLADDLVGVQQPRTIDAVRLRWARQYYRTTTALAVAPDSTTKDA